MLGVKKCRAEAQKSREHHIGKCSGTLHTARKLRQLSHLWDIDDVHDVHVREAV